MNRVYLCLGAPEDGSEPRVWTQSSPPDPEGHPYRLRYSPVFTLAESLSELPLASGEGTVTFVFNQDAFRALGLLARRKSHDPESLKSVFCTRGLASVVLFGSDASQSNELLQEIKDCDVLATETWHVSAGLLRNSDIKISPRETGTPALAWPTRDHALEDIPTFYHIRSIISSSLRSAHLFAPSLVELLLEVATAAQQLEVALLFLKGRVSASVYVAELGRLYPNDELLAPDKLLAEIQEIANQPAVRQLRIHQLRDEALQIRAILVLA